MASSGEGPIRHTSTFKLKNKEDKFKYADGLRSLKALPGVTFTSFNVVTDLGIVDTNADVSLIADFPDKESYLAYANHPQHLTLKVANKDLIANTLAIQFDVSAK